MVNNWPEDLARPEAINYPLDSSKKAVLGMSGSSGQTTRILAGLNSCVLLHRLPHVHFCTNEKSLGMQFMITR